VETTNECPRPIQRAVADIRRGENIDVYLTILVCSGAILASTFNLVGEGSLINAILAALVLIAVTNIKAEKRQNEAMEQLKWQRSALDLLNSGNDIYHSLRDEHYQPHIDRCVALNMICVANFRFLAANVSQLSGMIKRGGKMRQIMLNKDKRAAVNVATSRSVGASQEYSHTIGQIQATIDKLCELKLNCSASDQIQVKHTSFVTNYVVNWFEFGGSEPDLMFIVLPGFRQTTDSRLSLIIRSNDEPEAFSFFKSYFENLWSWENSAIVNLDE